MKKNTKLFGVFAALFLCALTAPLVGCRGGQGSSVSESIDENPDVTIKISSTVNQVPIGGTITIRVLVMGTASRDVTWSTSNSNIATVDGGTVTGIAVGEVDITATLVAYPSKSATQRVNVIEATAPTSINAGETNQLGWVDENITLDLEFVPETADKRVNYTSNNPAVAIVNDEGVISFLKKGTANITITSFLDSTISTTINFTVKDGPFWTNKGGYSNYFDYSHQGDETDPYVSTNFTMTGDNLPTYAWFKLQPTQRYYAEATISFGETTVDPWTRVGIGSATTDTDTRAFYFSDKEGQKTMMLDFPVEFGGNQHQSTIWRVNGIYAIDKTDFKLGILRDGNDYYYTINGKLYWFEENNRFTGIGSTPLIIGKDVAFTIFDAYSTVDEEVITAKLNSDAYKERFFSASSLGGQVIYTKDTDSWRFNNLGREDWNNICMGQQRAKALGDKGLAKGNFKIEFDISAVEFEETNIANSMAGVTMRRYNSWEPDMESICLTKDHIQYRHWNLESPTNAFETGKLTAVDSATFALVDVEKTYHIAIERTILGARSEFKVTMDGEVIQFNEADTYRVNFIGKYLVSFGANDCKATISNFTITNL